MPSDNLKQNYTLHQHSKRVLLGRAGQKIGDGEISDQELSDAMKLAQSIIDQKLGTCTDIARLNLPDGVLCLRAKRVVDPLMLIVIAAEQARKRHLWLNPVEQAEAFRRALERAFTEFEVISCLARDHRISQEQILADSSKLLTLNNLRKRFANAVAPRLTKTMAKDGSLDQASATWSRQQQWDSAYLIKMATHAFAGMIPADQFPNGAGDLASTIGAARLAAMSADALQTAAANYIAWSPLVEFDTNPAAGERNFHLKIERADQIKKLTDDVYKRVSHRYTRDEVKAALSKAFLDVRHPKHAYRYAAPYPQYIAARAANHVASVKREEQRKAETISASTASRGARPSEHRENEEAGDAIICRLHYLTILEAASDVPWTTCLLRGLIEEQISDERLRRMLFMDSGKRLSVAAVRQIRQRLLRCLRAVCVILDAPGDQLVPALIDHAQGSAERGLRRAVFDAKAARHDGDQTMSWPAIAWLIAGARDDQVMTVATRAADGITFLASSDDGKIVPSVLAEADKSLRLTRIERWWKGDRTRLSRLRMMAAKRHLGDLIGTALYLRVVQALTVDQAVAAIDFIGVQQKDDWRALLEGVDSI